MPINLHSWFNKLIFYELSSKNLAHTQTPQRKRYLKCVAIVDFENYSCKSLRKYTNNVFIRIQFINQMKSIDKQDCRLSL